MSTSIPSNRFALTSDPWLPFDVHLPLGGVARSASAALPPFLGEGSPIKIDYKIKGILILSSLLEDLGGVSTSIRLQVQHQLTKVERSACAESALARLT